jgi:hypothetical protein
MKFDYREIPADLLQAEAKKWRANMVEAAAEANEELMNKYLEEGDLTEEKSSWSAHPYHGLRNPADAVWVPPSRTRAFSACSTRSSTTCRRPTDIPAVKGTGRRRENARRSSRHAR